MLKSFITHMTILTNLSNDTATVKMLPLKFTAGKDDKETKELKYPLVYVTYCVISDFHTNQHANQLCKGFAFDAAVVTVNCGNVM